MEFNLKSFRVKPELRKSESAKIAEIRGMIKNVAAFAQFCDDCCKKCMAPLVIGINALQKFRIKMIYLYIT